MQKYIFRALLHYVLQKGFHTSKLQENHIKKGDWRNGEMTSAVKRKWNFCLKYKKS